MFETTRPQATRDPEPALVWSKEASRHGVAPMACAYNRLAANQDEQRIIEGDPAMQGSQHVLRPHHGRPALWAGPAHQRPHGRAPWTCGGALLPCTHVGAWPGRQTWEQRGRALTARPALGDNSSMRQTHYDYTRTLSDGRVIAVERLFGRQALLSLHAPWSHVQDGWVYASLETALAAATAWDGREAPSGWVRHPKSGRRRPGGDPARESILPLVLLR
jgi:hypothetical protein